MRVQIGDIVKCEAGVGHIVAEWDDNKHIDVEVNGERFNGIDRGTVEPIK